MVSCQYYCMAAPLGLQWNTQKKRLELHKDTVYCFEQIQEVTLYKTTTIQPLTSRHTNYQVRHGGRCWRSKDEFISDILLWTPTYGHTGIDWPAETCIHQFCVDTRCYLEDLLRAMADRESKESMLLPCLYDDEATSLNKTS